ncbi:phage tail terminator family protein [Clostridium beijerinckii]|uniref:phage tail terminator family protein n=1 Tax=Clostridium beijerinckii TaxID=1520 RepID=UPI00098C90D6|nr:hypothetical protein [Clostridium beijerinckii]NRT78119.1 hypothetical protein [Clostridium beijerinckii]OOM44801.1 hypothetical protein CBEIJ_35470 [Clostridium beijerinckii]
MKNIDIQQAIIDKFYNNIPSFKIKDEQNKSDVTGETIFINVRPLKTYNYQYNKNKLLNVTITYKTDIMSHENNLNIMDTFENIFSEKLNVGDRYLTIGDLDFIENDDFISCNFTLDYFDDLNYEYYDDKPKDYDKMESLKLKNI